MNEVSSFLVAGIPDELVRTFAHLALAPDAADAGLIVEHLFADGLSPETVMLDLLAPAARFLGEMWCADELGFMEVTIGLSRIQHLLRQFRALEGHGVAAKGRALLAPAPGEQHRFGLRVVEEFLLRDGWEVRLAMTGSLDDLLHLVAADVYDFVGFSISGERLLPALRSAIREVRARSRNRDVRIMVGGVLFAGPASCRESFHEADATVSDAEEAVARASEWYAMAGVT